MAVQLPQTTKPKSNNNSPNSSNQTFSNKQFSKINSSNSSPPMSNQQPPPPPPQMTSEEDYLHRVAAELYELDDPDLNAQMPGFLLLMQRYHLQQRPRTVHEHNQRHRKTMLSITQLHRHLDAIQQPQPDLQPQLTEILTQQQALQQTLCKMHQEIHYLHQQINIMQKDLEETRHHTSRE